MSSEGRSDRNENNDKRCNESSDEEEGFRPPRVKRKGRRSKYMLWAEPDEDDEDIPWSTLKGLTSGAQSAQQLQGAKKADTYCHESSTTVGPHSSPEENNVPSEDEGEHEAYLELSGEASPASTVRVSTDSVESESDTENLINLNEDSSEDEHQEDNHSEEQFIPVDNLADVDPIEAMAVIPARSDNEHEERETTFQDSIIQDAQDDQSASVHSPPHAVPTPAIPAFKSTLEKFMDPHFSETVSAKVCISPKEILFNLLNLNEAHNINRTLFVNISKLINSMFSEPVIPDTSFKLDSFLLSTSGVMYHFYCKKCVKLLRNPDKSSFVTCKCGTINNVSDLDKASYFISFDICTQLEIILRDPEVAAKLINVQSYQCFSQGMQELYDGEVHRKFRISLDFRDGALHLSIIVCADASPLYKSSNCDITPFLASINELPFRERMKKAFLLGMWFGPPKPMYKTFLGPIVRRLKKLSTEGAIINVGGKQTFVKVHCIGGCFDSGARGPIQGIHLHNGEYGCNWCLHPGETEGHGSSARKFKYLENPPTLRTHQQVVSDAKAAESLPRPRSTSAPTPHVNGVLASSALLKLPGFDIVNGMVLDSMHNSFLGVVRQFLRLWCGLEGNLKLPDGTMPGYYIGSPALMEKIDARIALLVVPLEFRRLPRSLLELIHYKAHELENFLSIICLLSLMEF